MILPCILFSFYIKASLLRSDFGRLTALAAVIGVCPPFCFHQFPGKPVSSTHAYFAFYRHMGLCNQWKGVKIVWFHARALSSRRRRTVKHAFKRRRFLLLQFKDFFLPGLTISIPDIGKWCISQLMFQFDCVFSPFCVSEQVGSVTIRSCFSTHLFQL